MEHLNDGGVSGAEAVSEQVGVHDVRPSDSTPPWVEDEVPSAMSVDIDGDGVEEHSTYTFALIASWVPKDVPS